VHIGQDNGWKINVLADLFIGAHTGVTELPVLTRYVRRYSSCIFTVSLIAPR
jgi:hypothetical protein